MESVLNRIPVVHISSNNYFIPLDRFKSIQDLRKLKVHELKSILKNFGDLIGEKRKSLLVQRSNATDTSTGISEANGVISNLSATFHL